MKTFYGIVREVYIPDGNVIEFNQIGFRIELENSIINIVQEPNEENAKIMKNDRVQIIKQVIDNKEFIDIIKVGDEEDE